MLRESVTGKLRDTGRYQQMQSTCLAARTAGQKTCQSEYRPTRAGRPPLTSRFYKPCDPVRGKVCLYPTKPTTSSKARLRIPVPGFFPPVPCWYESYQFLSSHSPCGQERVARRVRETGLSPTGTAPTVMPELDDESLLLENL